MATEIQSVPDAVLAADFPTSADREAGQWNSKATAWANSENAMVNRAREIAQTAHNNATAATEQATIATTKAGEASTSAQTATDKADEAAATALNLAELDALWLGAATSDPATGKDGAPLVAGNAYINSVTGYLRAYNGTEWVQGVSAVAGVSSLNGQVGALVLKTLNGAPLLGEGNIAIDSSIYRIARTSNTQLAAADKGNLIDITSGTFTQTFAAAEELGDGWYCYLKNSGTGDVTIPASDGRADWIMYPAEMRLFQCDGGVLRSIVLNGFYKVFTASGNFVKPPGYGAFDGLLWAGGGGGGKCGSTAAAYGCTAGGGGACVPFSVAALSLTNSGPIVIGAGGNGAGAGYAAGGKGGDSEIGPIKSYGGGGGYGDNSVNTYYGGGGGGSLSAGASSTGSTSHSAGGSPATATTSAAFGGGAGSGGGALAGSIYGGGGGGGNGVGGNSVYGGGGGGGGRADGASWPAGQSTLGGSGGAFSATGSAGNGVLPGGGGGATATGTAGTGGGGQLTIWGVI